LKFLFPCLLLIACTSGKMMNAESFSCVMMGMSEKQLVAVAGKPYSTCKNEDGSVVYEYIERFNGYNRKIMQVNYYVTVKNGKVTHKKTEKSYPPSYIYNALDYQTKNDSAKKTSTNSH